MRDVFSGDAIRIAVPAFLDRHDFGEYFQLEKIQIIRGSVTLLGVNSKIVLHPFGFREYEVEPPSGIVRTFGLRDYEAEPPSGVVRMEKAKVFDHRIGVRIFFTPRYGYHIDLPDPDDGKIGRRFREELERQFSSLSGPLGFRGRLPLHTRMDPASGLLLIDIPLVKSPDFQGTGELWVLATGVKGDPKTEH